MNAKPGTAECCDLGVKGSRQVKKAEKWYMLWANGIDEVIMNVKGSSFRRVVFTVSRLMGIKKIITY